jgi:hypothetical protein
MLVFLLPLLPADLLLFPLLSPMAVDKLGKRKSHISMILSGKMNLTLRVIVELETALGVKILKIEF